jgi:hypothetical protein
MPEMDKQLGLYTKYDIYYKVDADPLWKLEVCDMFVLDLTHDPYAVKTLLEWRRSWEEANPGKLAPDTQIYSVHRRKQKGDPHPGKHKNCEFWVLNVTIDPHALKALPKYIELCQETYPGLASDLTQMVRRNTLEEEKQLRWEPQVQEVERVESGLQGGDQEGRESASSGEPLHEGTA